MRLLTGSGLASLSRHEVPRLRPSRNGKAVGIEETAAVGRNVNVVVLQAAVHRTERRQQPGPRIVAAFEQFFAVLVGQFPQLLADRGDGVVLFVDGERLAGDQFPLLGTEQEHQPHHHREGRLVQNFFPHPGQQFPAKVLIGPVERMDQHFDRPPHLIAKLVGDFLLVGALLASRASSV